MLSKQLNTKSAASRCIRWVSVLLLLLAMPLAQTFAPVEAAPTGSVGAPGTVFRYEETFGETGVAYLADNDHLYHPVGLGLDGAGNLWVAEGFGARAMEYSGGGAFLKSIGTAGLIYGADETHFAGPNDVSVDSAGNIWVVDLESSRVASFDPAGSYLSQLGVTGEPGADNDHFDAPAGIAFDSSGNIYVSDTHNYRIQVFNSSGVYSETLGQTGVPGSGDYLFDGLSRIAIDEDDRLYVADAANHRVQIFDASLTYSTTLGMTGMPGGGNNQFDSPRGVAVDSSFIYVADSNNHRVQVFSRGTGIYEDTLGGFGSGDYQFNRPRDVAVDSAGNLYVADSFNHRVQKYDSNLAYVRTFGVTGVPYLTDSYHYNFPSKVAVNAGGDIALLEDEGRGHRLILLDASGAPQFTIGEAGVYGGDNDHLNDARGVTFDADGNIYVGDCANQRVQIFTSAGVYSDTLGEAGVSGSDNDHFFCPTGVAFDASGNFYVVDSGNHRLQIFDSNLVYSETLGVTGVSGSDDDHFFNPRDVAVDADGNIYVADTDNQRVQKFDSSLTYQMTLGVTGECGDEFDHFCVPMGLAVDGAGNLYVSEWWNPRVQVFDSSGAYLTTIGGEWGDHNSQFFHLPGVAVDGAGNVYIPDMINHRLQKFAPGVPGWQQVNINGFGERYANGVSALEEFNGMLYAGASNWFTGGQIYRSSDGATWSAVSAPGFTSTYTSTNAAIIDLAVFGGQLYASAGWNDHPGQAWRSADGTTWEPVTTDGFGEGGNIAVSAFTAFNGMLYAGTGNYGTGSPGSGAQIWRSASGDAGDWTKVAPDEAGTENTFQVTGFAVYKGALYAAIEAIDVPGGLAQVWRSANGSAWDTVVPDGFGDADNVGTGGFAVFDGYLYLGTQNNVSGAQLWRTSDGTTWEPVVGDGFGDAANQKVEMLTVFASWL